MHVIFNDNRIRLYHLTIDLLQMNHKCPLFKTNNKLFKFIKKNDNIMHFM